MKESKHHVLGRSFMFTPDVINDIHIKADLGRYRMRGFSLFKPIPSWDDLTFLPGTLTRFVIEGYRENSQHLTVLIMTNHSFNRSGNIINQELEGFYADNARTPMDAIAAKNPVLIIDEPQRVEGTKTVEQIKNFNPMFVLRYSATFREGQIKNLVYVLDSYDAFNNKLVKGITVTDYKSGTIRLSDRFITIEYRIRRGINTERWPSG